MTFGQFGHTDLGPFIATMRADVKTLTEVIWQGIADSCFGHDADRERRECDELHSLVPEQREADCE